MASQANSLKFLFLVITFVGLVTARIPASRKPQSPTSTTIDLDGECQKSSSPVPANADRQETCKDVLLPQSLAIIRSPRKDQISWLLAHLIHRSEQDLADCISLNTTEGHIVACPTCTWLLRDDGSDFNVLVEGAGCASSTTSAGTEFYHSGPSYAYKDVLDALSQERCRETSYGLWGAFLKMMGAAAGKSKTREDKVRTLECFGCKQWVDGNAFTHFACPGCEKVLNPAGQLWSEFGPRCFDYEMDMPKFEDRSTAQEVVDAKLPRVVSSGGGPKEPDWEGCTVVRSRGRVKVVVCNGCVIVFDDDGNETVRTGWRCSDYEFDLDGSSRSLELR